MSGHSKWATIKRKKGALDAARGKLFTKLIKEITVSARMGGGDPNGNARLRAAIDAAKEANMPQDNVTRAIKKGTGELEGVNYEEVNYEGYGPGGAAIMASVLTDNRNRTVSELRRIFEKHSGNMGSAGCVAWMFHKRGVITVEKDKVEEDRLMEVALEAGADDVSEADDSWEIITAPESFETVKAAVDAAEIARTSAEITMVPENTVSLTGKEAEHTIKLLEELEEHDDVQSVASNVDIPQEELERLSAA